MPDVIFSQFATNYMHQINKWSFQQMYMLRLYNFSYFNMILKFLSILVSQSTDWSSHPLSLNIILSWYLVCIRLMRSLLGIHITQLSTFFQLLNLSTGVIVMLVFRSANQRISNNQLIDIHKTHRHIF